MKLVRKKYEFTDKNGDKKIGYNYTLILDNGFSVVVKPAFKDSYKILFYSSVEE